MTGRQWTTTSPSSTSSSRRTPCVEGCCGPMLTVSSSLGEDSACAIDRPSDREVDGFAADRLAAAERVAAPVVGQHDAGQIGMPRELDAEEVEHFTLVPV